MDGQFWVHLLQITLIDLVLSSDNAIVIGMACRGLPPKLRRMAILYGTMGAIVLRVALTGLTTWMLDIPLLKMIGGGLLLWISLKLMLGFGDEEGEIAKGDTLCEAVKTIILADLIMGLDNVLAIGGAAHGDIWLVLFGLGFSIPLLMWGSSWVARLMGRYPALVYGGAGLLAYTGAEMCLEDPYVWKVANEHLFNHAWVPLAVALGVVLVGRWRKTL